MTNLWRLKSDARSNVTKIMPHDEFLKRIQKTLYTSSMSKCQSSQSISRPLSVYAADVFNKDHRGYSLNRLSYVTVGNLQYATPCSLILSMIYLDRLREQDPGYCRRITPTELFLVSMMVSTKFYCGYDEDVDVLSDWAKHGHITADHLKRLELEFLCAINWNLYVSNQDFFEKLKLVEIELGKRQGLNRGWLTYTELSNLLPSLAIAKAFLQHTTVFAVSYAASVVTIAGAFFLASRVPGTALYSLGKAETTTKLNITSNNTELNHSTHALGSESDRVQTEDGNQCCDIDQSVLERLNEDLLENGATNQSTQQIPSAIKSPVAGIVINIPKTNYVTHPNIGIQNGVNLRSYLDGNESGSKLNQTVYLTTLHHVTDENLCRNFGNLVTWMKLI